MITGKKIMSWALMAAMTMGTFMPAQTAEAKQAVVSYGEEFGKRLGTNEAGQAPAASGEATTEQSTEQQPATTEQQTTTQQPATTEQTATTQQPATTEQTQTTTETPISIYKDTGLSPVKAKTIVIDPGHCKKHPGAKGNGLREEVVNLDISLAFRDYLDTYGDVTVYMTREDGSCCTELKVGDCLASRNNYAKKLDADFLVSVHINAGSSNGANVLAAYNSGFNDSIRKETQAFGKIALARLKEIGIANRGLLLRKSGSGNKYSNGRLADYYSIVRRGVIQNIPGVIIEHGYITSSSDCNKFFKTKAKRTKVGEADAKAVIDYYGLNKKTVAGKFYQENNETYFMAADNTKMAGWVKDAGKWYYFDTMSGKMQKGFLTLNGDTFYLSPNTGEMIVGWFTVDGKQYLSKGNGVVVKNQIYGDGQYNYLFDGNGQTVKKGFYEIDGDRYYVNSKKRLAAGLTKIGSNKYYFNTATGKMETGWKKISNKYYYFNKSNGKMQKSKWIGKYYVNWKGIRTKKK